MSKSLTLKEKANDVRSLLKQYETQIAEVLPSHLTPERMIQVAMAACSRNPKLLDCSKASIIQAVMSASELGMDLNPVMGHCAIIPYKDTATFQPMYKGLLDLAYRSGRVTMVQGHIVYSNDEFAYEFGLDPKLTHKPVASDRGEKIGAYVIARIKDMDPIFHYMSKEDIEKHRDKYSRAWQKSDSPWQTSPDPMWLKTVFIQLCRWLPKSTEMANLEKAVLRDYEAETGMKVLPDTTIDVEGIVVPDTDALDAIADELDKASGDMVIDTGEEFEFD